MQILQNEIGPTHLTEEQIVRKFEDIKERLKKGEITEEKAREERDGLRRAAAGQEN